MHLRATRAIRQSRNATMKRSGVGRFNDAISFRDRLAEIEDLDTRDHCRQHMHSMCERGDYRANA
jgi:hypothetical protein